MAEERKHTEGPWAEHGDGGCECGIIFGPDGNSHICMVYGPMHLSSEGGPDCVPNRAAQIANARLVAAAPDLLEALQNTFALLRAFTTEEDAVAKAAWEQARAAIKRATEG